MKEKEAGRTEGDFKKEEGRVLPERQEKKEKKEKKGPGRQEKRGRKAGAEPEAGRKKEESGQSGAVRFGGSRRHRNFLWGSCIWRIWT